MALAVLFLMWILWFVLFLTPPVLAAPLCEPVIDSQNPRRVDIQFPNKIVSVVGHQHPKRNGVGEAEGLEIALGNLISGATKIETPKEIRQARERLNQLLKRDAPAVRHWREDLKTLEQAVSENKVMFGFIEIKREFLTKLIPAAPYFVSRGPEILQKLGFTPQQAEELVMISLSPALYYQAKHSETPFWASTAEPSDMEDEVYTKNNCPPRKDADADLQLVAEELFAKLKQRGLSEKTIANRFALGMKAFGAKFEKDIGGELRAENGQRLFLNGAGMTFTSDEKQIVHKFFNKFFEDRPRGLNIKSLERDLAANIKNYRGCWGRDALMARNQARGYGNSILFVGIGHLAPQAALLKRECLNQLRSLDSKEPAAISTVAR